MNQNDKHHNSRWLKLSYRQISLISVVILISVSIGLSVYSGLEKAQSESKTNPIIMHIHPKLNVTIDNKTTMVPNQIGIDPSLWSNHTLDNYGMQEMPEMSMAGMAPLHTHESSGTIHVESSINKNYTLEEFLNIWGIDLNDKTIKASVDGKPVHDYKSIILKDGEQINLDISTNR